MLKYWQVKCHTCVTLSRDDVCSFTCVFTTIISEDICPTHPKSCPCQKKQGCTVSMNFINFQIIVSLPSSLCAHSIGNSLNPLSVCYLRVLLCWMCTPDLLTSMFSGDQEWLIRLLSWVWKDAFYAQTVPQSMHGQLGWLFSDDEICMSLSNGVCWHGSRRTGGRKKRKKKGVTPLLKWEGGQHGMAELTNKKRSQFSSV